MEIKFGKPLVYKKKEIAWITEEEEFGAEERRDPGEKTEAKGMVRLGAVLWDSQGSAKDLLNITRLGQRDFLWKLDRRLSSAFGVEMRVK